MSTLTVKLDILQFVTFKLAEEEYALDILRVQEINRMTEITPLPNSPDYIEGVINLRGKVIPVVNLRKIIGFNAKEMDFKSRVIVLHAGGVTFGIVVDSVSEVLRIPSDTVEPPPPMASGIGSEYIKGIGRIDDRLLILMDIDRLFSADKKDIIKKIS